MTTSLPLRAAARHAWTRFSLRGLMVLMLTLGIGLAYSRLGGFDGPSFLRGCFASWLVMGLFEKARHRWQDCPVNHRLPREYWWGWSMQVVWPLAVIGLVVFVACMEVARLTHWRAVEGFDPSRTSISATTVESIFLVAVMCAYWPVSRDAQIEPYPRPWWIRMVCCAGWVLIAWWLAPLLTDLIFIPGLIHLAIRGVEAGQPTRWAGQPFYPFNPVADSQFVGRAMLAISLLGAAALLVTLFASLKPRSRIARIGFALPIGICLLVVAWLVNWWRGVGMPTSSPYLAMYIDGLEPRNAAVALVLVASAAAALALRLSFQPATNVIGGTSGAARRSHCIHEWQPVMLTFLLAVVWGDVALWWPRIWSLPSWSLPMTTHELWDALAATGEFLVAEPQVLLQLAASIVVVRRILRFDPLRDSSAQMDWTLRPERFAFTWFIACGFGFLTVPVASWLGLALLLKSGMP